MNEQSQLATRESELVTQQQPSILAMVEKAAQSGASAESLEKLVDLFQKMEKINAEKEFNRAFVQLQAELPVIVAESIIPNRGKYAKFEDVMHQIAPALKANGFAVSFSMDFKETRILETCHLRHISGHSHSNSFAVRSGKADSETQADCKAATTAKRNALCNALNIVIRQDVLSDESDGAIEGDVLTQEQINYLRKGVRATGSNEARFLAFAGAEIYEEIRQNRYEELCQFLQKKADKL